MITEENIKEIDRKLDLVLSILGHGRTKTINEIEREALQMYAQMTEKKARRKKHE